MASKPSAGPTGNTVFAVPPPNGYPMMLGGMPQVSLYPSCQPQVHLISGNPSSMEPLASLQQVQRGLKEGKVLGALQILIGLVHMGLGAIMITIATSYYYSAMVLYGGFPFWGGFWLIVSGAVSVSAEKQPQSPCLLNVSLGLNIFTAICSMGGIILLLTDFIVTGNLPYPDYNSGNPALAMAVSGVLLVFCLLGFCVTCTASHFGCQVACYQQQSNVAVIFPETCVVNPGVNPEYPPPAYSHNP
ncbi:membrane-spanning 4-domains subfamily A member 8 [Erinaceus europaeus]|uniref:Membrane-spanning 4-domains subfamily A member 8 n=1 Tax=Erinaceus europaeus TaxID=9365 RepID=A0A1S2ZI40_ERIEU|nr:membrane-spanning 4-domains subfamily A member 8 [Erinaceus europaeus]